jgi:hypothetical protein
LRPINILFFLIFFSVNIYGHGGVTRVSILKEADHRLFVADNLDSTLITIDFPSGEIINRVSTPPSIMTLQIGGKNNYIFAMRGRDTDQDLVSIIDTGYDKLSQNFRQPLVLRTLPMDTPGGGRNKGGHVMATVNGFNAVLTEGNGEIVVFETDDFDGFSELKTKIYNLASPDHYHYQEGEKFLYIGHLFGGFIQILDKNTGEEHGRIDNCPRLHGMGRDNDTGRLFFSCMREVVVVGTRGKERAREVSRIVYPGTGRSCAAFLEGRESVRWCYTEGIIPQLYRLDASNKEYQFEILKVEPSIRQQVTKDGKYLMILTREGSLSLHDGYDGSFVRNIKLSDTFEGEWNEDVGKAILPDIVSHDGIAYVSLTHEGRVAEIDLEAGEVIRYIETGGFPSRMVLLSKEELN